MNEKKIILTEEQFDEALRFAAMGGAGLLHPNDAADTLKKLPREIGGRALASALAAGCIKTKAPETILEILEMIVKEAGNKE